MRLPVTVVMVTYESRDTVVDAISALEPAHREADLRFLLVDNASRDGTLELVRARFPWVEARSSGGNLGFGRANNLALPLVTTPYLLFLNPDASIDGPNLERMVAYLDEHPSVAFLGPAIVDEGRASQLACAFPSPGLYLADALGRRASFSGSRIVQVGSPPCRADWISGAVLLARTSVVRELGGFDARFFLYYEEADLCYRARRLGYEAWTMGTAVASHAAGTSARRGGQRMFRGCIAEHYFRSRLYYLRKHYGLVPALATELIEYALLAARVVARKALRRPADGDASRRLRAPLLRMPPRPSRASATP